MKVQKFIIIAFLLCIIKADCFSQAVPPLTPRSVLLAGQIALMRNNGQWLKSVEASEFVNVTYHPDTKQLVLEYLEDDIDNTVFVKTWMGTQVHKNTSNRTAGVTEIIDLNTCNSGFYVIKISNYYSSIEGEFQID